MRSRPERRRALCLLLGTVAAATACGPAPAASTSWAAAGGPAPGAAVDTGPDTRAAEAPSPPPAPVAPPRPAPTSPTVPPGVLTTYRGTIGARHVVVRTTCNANCGGYVLFEDVGDTVQLRQVDPKTFEAVSGLRDHGSTVGKLSLDAAPGKSLWRGRFAPSSGPSVPIWLSRVAPSGRPIAVRRVLSDRSTTDAKCTVKIESFEIVGARDPILEWRVNQAFSPETLARVHLQDAEPEAGEKAEFDETPRGSFIHCRIALQPDGGCYIDAAAKVAFLDEHLVSVAFRSDDAAGGAHPDFIVGGATIDLSSGEVLDARELLADPTKDPPWATFVVPTPELVKAIAGQTVEVQYATGGVGSRTYAWSNWPWKPFWVTATGIAFEPAVDEFHKPLRELIQQVPYTKVKSALRTDGPAAYLWSGRRAKR